MCRSTRRKEVLTVSTGLEQSVQPEICVEKKLRSVPGTDVAVGVGAIRHLNLPVKPLIDGRLVRAVPAEIFAEGRQLRVPVLIGAANGESGARQLSDEVATGGAFGFQRRLADQMQRAGQPVWMFQLTYVPPQARASRQAAQHGETVAYAFGTFGQSVAAQYGLGNSQVANRAARGGWGGGRENDALSVEESEQGRRISSAMLEYWVTSCGMVHPVERICRHGLRIRRLHRKPWCLAILVFSRGNRSRVT